MTKHETRTSRKEKQIHKQKRQQGIFSYSFTCEFNSPKANYKVSTSKEKNTQKKIKYQYNLYEINNQYSNSISRESKSSLRNENTNAFIYIKYKLYFNI
jgi:hypothetical protein